MASAAGTIAQAGTAVEAQATVVDGESAFTYSLVATFLVLFVQANKGSAASVRNTLSQLRTQARITGMRWLSPSDEERVKDVVKQLEYYDDSGPWRVKPLQLYQIERICSKLDLQNSLEIMLALLLSLGFSEVRRC